MLLKNQNSSYLWGEEESGEPSRHEGNFTDVDKIQLPDVSSGYTVVFTLKQFIKLE